MGPTRRSKEHSFAIKGLWGRIKNLGAMIVYVFTQDQEMDPVVYVYKCWCGRKWKHIYDHARCPHSGVGDAD